MCLLSFSLFSEEKRFQQLEIKETGKTSISLVNGLPSSCMLLNMAHEQLGRRGWCTMGDGALLCLMIIVYAKGLESVSSLSKSHPIREDIEQELQQCFYCLYTFPHKKSRAKHLDEHNAPPVS